MSLLCLANGHFANCSLLPLPLFHLPVWKIFSAEACGATGLVGHKARRYMCCVERRAKRTAFPANSVDFNKSWSAVSGNAPPCSRTNGWRKTLPAGFRLQ
jgi:hypothetical protein